jgi:hypothetical protein
MIESLELRQLLSVNPIISEILADNETGIRDSSGNRTDWLEIHNPNSQQAVDLTGWKIQYSSSTWTFPSMSLGPGESRVIFCATGLSQTDPNQELHANFNLSKSGKYLALLNNSGVVVQSFSPTFPALDTDVSYGTGQGVEETKLVAAGATARYCAPTSNSLGSTWTQPGFNDSGWASGPTGLGFVNLVPGFAVTNYKSNLSSISNVAQAQSVIDNVSNQSWSDSETAGVINYMNTGGGGEFPSGDNPFPGMPINADYECFVTKATGLVHIPSAGSWTFGVNSDDGFSCTVNGQTFAFDGLRGPGDSFGTISFAAAGDYDLSLVFFENGGGSSLELFAAPGAKAGFDSTFRLVGDTANGGLAVQSTPFTGNGSSSVFVNSVMTNVQAAMQAANNASLYTRISFDAPDLASLQSLTLKMQYDDGYVAYLNGVEVARRNAPPTVTWNSQAVAERTSDVQVTTFENVDVSAFLNSAAAGHLMATGNVLAIQVMKSSLSGGDMLVVPELSQIVTTQLGNHFFAVPTPGTANTIDTWQPDISFSVQRGIFYQSFPVTITTTTTGASIYYTLDGSIPSAVNGTHYTGPITISTTATLRAVSVVGGGSAGVVSTETYVFPNDVINQTANQAGYPTTWGTEAADYGMDTRITTDPTYKNQLVQSLLSLPTMSIVTDQASLFDPVTGIYSNAMRGDLEVPASLEYFDPATGKTFQINAALRMQGGVGRYVGFEKHSFRFIFKAPYGPGKLDFPLFGDEATDSFDTVTLRANFNDAWVWGQNQAQYIRDQFADETLLAMGGTASHGNYVQLYVNGMYWGLYNPTERPDTSFAATYLGGEKDNWDVVVAGESANGSDLTEYYELANFDFQSGSTAAYQRVQGNNPDGTRNPTYPVLLDMNNFVDYTLMNLYIGNVDWPNHNWYMARSEDSSPTNLDSTGFKFLPWDSEMATGLQWAYNPNVNALGSGSWNGWVASAFDSLRNNAEFCSLFADHAQKFLFNDGPLTVAAAKARYQSLANEVQSAITAESARWGDVSGTLYKPTDWLSDRDYVLNTWLTQRTDIVIQQLRNEGLYPSANAPSYSVNGAPQYGGLFNPGDTLTITASTSPIYYTLDGSDPRLAGGGLNHNAILYTGPITLTQGIEIKARVYAGGIWTALADVGFYVNLAPSIRITELMYHPNPATADEISRGYTGSDNNDFEYVEIRNIGDKTLPLAGLRFDRGITFTFPNISIAPGQSVLVVANQTAFHIRYPGVSMSLIVGQYSGHLDSAGEEVRLNAPNGGVVQDFTYDDAWYDQTDGEGFSLTIRDPLQAASLWASAAGWRASAAPNGSPGGDEANPIPNPGSIIINEVLANPSTSRGDMVELHNTTNHAINIGGWFLSDSSTNLTKYQLAANMVIAAGGYLVLTDDRNYGVGSGDSGAHVPFSLPVLGGDLYLSSNFANLAGGYREHVDVDYAPVGVSQGIYTKSTGETDFTLLDTPTFGSVTTLAGAANSIPYVASVVFNEVMYHPAAPTASEQAAGFSNEDDFEFIELCNRSGSPQTLNSLLISDGVGFTFGWYPNGTGSERWTLESGATATWSAGGLQTGSYTVYAHYSLVDGNGNRRTNLDGTAQYTVTYAGGSTTVTVDQNQTSVTGSDVWVNLGVYSVNGPAIVTLTRGGADPSNWTVADSVRFTAAGRSDVVVGSPTLHSFSIDNGAATLAPGASIVLVSNLAAFDYRYHVVANNIPVAGTYSGRLSNGGDMIRLDQFDSAYPGNTASFEIDHVNYQTVAPWPTVADGYGPALIRIHTADYGNDPENWRASNAGGTPGTANIAIDESAPTMPTNLVGVAMLAPTRIVLTWTASTESQSSLDHYVIYRNGTAIGTSSTPSFSDTGVVSLTSYAYQVSAVNRDGFESVQSAAVTLRVPGITSYCCLDSRHIQIYFSEPLTSATIGLLIRYVFSGGTLTSAVFARNNTKITLTTATAMTTGADYTMTMNGLATVSGNQLPARQQFTFTYAPQGTGSILREYWNNIGYGVAVSDLTSSHNYPNYPSGRDLVASFEAPANWNDAYGTRIRGYVTPPMTGYYTFWLASDDNGELWLSIDENPVNKALIASVTSWTGSRDWNNVDNPTQQSASIYLEAGKRYYVEALQKEGGGGDNLAVRWQLPDGSWENGDSTIPIPGIRLTPYGGIDFTAPAAPATVRGTFNGSTQVSLTWSPSIDPESGVDHYVIYRDGVFRGTSTTAHFTDPSAATTLGRHSYQVSAVNYDGIEGARSLADTVITAGIASVSTVDSTTLRIVFTEPLDSVSSQTTANYAIGGVTISSASLAADNITVTLTTSSLDSATSGLTVRNVKTRAGVALPNHTVSLPCGEAIDYDYGFAVGVNALSTGDTTPVLRGTVSDAAASVTVRVAGIYYSAVNNGDGTWTLSEGAIVSPLSAGTYDVLAAAVNASGRRAYDASLSDLVIDLAAPTVIVAAVTPIHQVRSVDSIAIQFSEPVSGFGIGDLLLTRGGLTVSMNGMTLTTSDGRIWTLGNLSTATSALGDYALTLAATGANITDLAGNVLTVGANATWLTMSPLPGDFNIDGLVDELDLNIWKANLGIEPNATFQMGDANNDGCVDGLDLDLWKANRGKVLSAPAASGNSDGDESATATATANGSATPPAPATTTVNARPSAAMTTPVGVRSGCVAIDFSVLDPDSDPCSVLVQFSPDGGTTWKTATLVSGEGDVTTGLAMSPTGMSHTLSWDSNSDLINTDNSLVKLRIVPSDASGEGATCTTDVFTVRNRTATAPMIRSVAVVEAVAPKNRILESNDVLAVTWVAAGPSRIVSQTVTIDGRIVARLNGANVKSNYSASIGKLAVGRHVYSIKAINAKDAGFVVTGQIDVVAPIVPAITAVAVAEAGAARNGIAESNEKLRVTWIATSSNGVASQIVKVDGKRITPIGHTGGSSYACPIGKRSAGDHVLVITTTDRKGVNSRYVGTLSVATTLAAGVSARSKNGVLDSNERLVLAWTTAGQKRIASQPITVDSRLVSSISGPTRDSRRSCPIGARSDGIHRVDVLTAVIHEMGHVLGYGDTSSDGLMNGILSAGVRRSAVDEVFATLHQV